MPKKFNIKFKYLVAAAAMLALAMPHKIVQAAGCPDLKIVFARGSGGERWNDKNFQTFKAEIESKIADTGIDYTFEDLDYPAVGVGAGSKEELVTTAGAFFGRGDSYEFGKSVDTGAKNLTQLVNTSACPNTRYVIGGYSQGAMVVSKSLPSLNPGRVIYAATFGDPKIYLPEGEGLIPDACFGKNLSDYRMYVPNCNVYEGMLGSYVPYEPEALIGKVGVWCNRDDIFCTPYMNMSSHTSYVADDLYGDASKTIAQKIYEAFGIDKRVENPHDTAILIDSTASMRPMIDQYKAEAKRLAEETFKSGGRVALYDYGDARERPEPTERCNFQTCTSENFADKLAEIQVSGGGDAKESLLSSSLIMMNNLNNMGEYSWQSGATKSVVVLTDAGFHSPDVDLKHTTVLDVIAASKGIDPVNFYIITEPENASDYQELADGTDGKVVTNMNELSLLTDHIMDRFDSLPRVEEGVAEALPTLAVDDVEYVDEHTSRVKFSTDAPYAIVILNDAVLGMTSEREITIGELDRSVANVLTLVPATSLADNGGVHGAGVNATLNLAKASAEAPVQPTQAVPKTPNTGIAR